MLKGDKENISPESENYINPTDPSNELKDLDLDLLEAELRIDPLSSEGAQNFVEEAAKEIQREISSDDLFGNMFDDLNEEELESLDVSSNSLILSAPQIGQPSVDEEEFLFGDGYDELMDIEFNETQPEVNLFMI
jgi:hypothetical protein